MRTLLPRPRTSGCADDGSATVEFCVLAVVLMVPLAYLILTVFQVQGAAYAAATATREAGRTFASSTGGEAWGRAEDAARVALADHGLLLEPGQLRVECGGTPCLAPGSVVRTSLVVQVPLPLVPALAHGVVPGSVRVQAEHVEYVDRFRESP